MNGDRNGEVLYARRPLAYDRCTAASLCLTTLAAVRAIGPYRRHTPKKLSEMGTTLLRSNTFLAASERSRFLSITPVGLAKKELASKLPGTHKSPLGLVAVKGVVVMGPPENKSIALEIDSGVVRDEQAALYKALEGLGETRLLPNDVQHVTLTKLQEDVGLEHGTYIPEAEQWMPPTISLGRLNFGTEELSGR